jgi:import receptor subunit TOM70
MASEHTGGIVERVQDFVSDNKRAIIIGTAALALAAGGAAAYYASTSSRPRGPGDVEKAERREKKKASHGKGSHGKKKKGVKDQDGPILEERVPPPKVEEVSGSFRYFVGSSVGVYAEICVDRGSVDG